MTSEGRICAAVWKQKECTHFSWTLRAQRGCLCTRFLTLRNLQQSPAGRQPCRPIVVTAETCLWRRLYGDRRRPSAYVRRSENTVGDRSAPRTCLCGGMVASEGEPTIAVQSAPQICFCSSAARSRCPLPKQQRAPRPLFILEKGSHARYYSLRHSSDALACSERSDQCITWMPRTTYIARDAHAACSRPCPGGASASPECHATAWSKPRRAK